MYKQKFFTLILTLVSLFFLLHEQVYSQWIETNGPWHVRCLAYSGNELFAGTASDFVHKSTDEGASWIKVNNGLTNPLIYSLAVVGNSLFAGTSYGGVFKSTNGGESWIPSGLIDQIIFAMAVNGNDLLAGTYPGGVFKSADGGVSWTNLNGPHWFVRSLAVMGGNIFAGTNNGGVFKSTNGGDSWSQCFPFPSSFILSLAVCGNDLFAGTDYGGGVFKSTDAGESWTLCGLTNEHVDALIANGYKLYAGTGDRGVFLSTNSGESWMDWNQGIGGSPEILSFVIAGDYIYCGAYNRPVCKRNKFEILNSICGPDPHFVDNCSAGTDSLDILHNCETNALIRISTDTSDNCNILTMPLPLFKGPTIIRRSDPKDTSERFPGAAQADGHNDIIETEFVRMDLRSFVVSTTGDTAFLRIIAGAGNAEGPCGDSLRPTFGYIHELPAYNFSAESFFDVFFELCIEDPYGIIGPPNPRYYLYNLMPVRMGAVIDQIPPKCGIDPITNENYTVYRSDPNACSKLYASCIPGLSGPPIAKVVHVDHALPVELASFTSSVTGNNVTLSWATSSEINNAGFAIERNSGSNWENAGFVTGQGTVNTISQYEFTERNLSSGRYQYRLKQTDFNGNYEYFSLTESVTIGVPQQFYLGQNYPNPFNPITTISFDIPEAGNVKLKVFDVSGREVKTIVNEFKNAGYYAVKFEAAGLASGAYFYRIEIADYVSVKKMIILK